MSLYGDYIKELHGREEVEGDGWFVTFEIKKPYCYLIDMYIVPEKRNKGLGLELNSIIEGIAKQKECNKILTSVDINCIKDDNIKLIKKCGYKLFKENKKGLFFIKDI